MPMINVVFLLLIFFLMTAQIAPAPPFDLTLPDAQAEASRVDTQPLYISQQGDIAFGALVGDAALIEAAQNPVSLHADAGLPGPRLAAVMTQLAQLGAPSISLQVSGGDDAAD